MGNACRFGDKLNIPSLQEVFCRNFAEFAAEVRHDAKAIRGKGRNNKEWLGPNDSRVRKRKRQNPVDKLE
jgi:hypothetical protein